VKPTGHAGPLTADGAPPILLIGGTDDPATPYAWAQSVNRQLAGSVLLTRNGNGHTSYDASACAHAAIDDYLINLTMPAPGTVCSS
jgi:pimeloyl-ACP methyl ester carboxylesterase